MLGTIMEIITILSYNPQFQEEQEDPYVPNKDNIRIQQTFKNKSCSKWPNSLLGTIMEVIIILSYPAQLQEEQLDV